MSHIPVLLQQFLEVAKPLSGVYVDCTLGYGGYTRAILEASNNTQVIAFDMDPSVAPVAKTIQEQYGDRFKFIQANFKDLGRHLTHHAIQKVDCIIADLGVSSMQLDQDIRGFSFAKDGPLDMRMSSVGTSAKDIINNISESDLAYIIATYGEERHAKKIAKNIIAYRQNKIIDTTLELADIVRKSIPRVFNFKIDPATKTFQAIRIHVNNELDNLKSLLAQAHTYLKSPGGMLAIISFHSLEDSIVKKHINALSDQKIHKSKYQHLAPKKLISEAIEPISCTKPVFNYKFHQLLLPNNADIASNSRARSGKLRITRTL